MYNQPDVLRQREPVGFWVVVFTKCLDERKIQFRCAWIRKNKLWFKMLKKRQLLGTITCPTRVEKFRGRSNKEAALFGETICEMETKCFSVNIHRIKDATKTENNSYKMMLRGC